MIIFILFSEIILNEFLFKEAYGYNSFYFTLGINLGNLISI